MLATLGISYFVALADFFDVGVGVYLVAFAAIGVLGIVLLIGLGLRAILPLAAGVGFVVAVLGVVVILAFRGAGLGVFIVPVVLALSASLLALWGSLVSWSARQ